MQNPNGLIVNAASNATANSNAIGASQWVTASFMAFFTDGTAAGTLQLQYSNDNPTGNPQFVPTNWANVPGATATAAVSAGANSTVYVPVNFVARWYRISWTRSAGAGTFSVAYDALFV